MAHRGNFLGIYRKVQLKPLKWDGEGEEERPVEALVILKYTAGVLGRFFRYNMYPGEGTGLLRLHSTYRHDFKIYISDEGRVQMSAAAFAKGLLDLEGQLTPILVSLVSKDSSMLNGLDTASIEMEAAKVESIGTVLLIDWKYVGAKKSIILYDVWVLPYDDLVLKT
ncbi:unnamed protein product [Brassica napus]|uniref:diphosphoinositol-pentakisphosphate 1-kinase n=1 Tax=Brassica napus TaxID=3708 RepID=A0A816LR59_BRANA|nr:unnamed protein product [Brassica napus]